MEFNQVKLFGCREKDIDEQAEKTCKGVRKKVGYRESVLLI